MSRKGRRVLESVIGQTADRIGLEVTLYEGDPEFTLDCGWIRFSDRRDFLFGCAGDGSIFVKRGRISKRSYLEGVVKTGVVRLHGLEGSVLGGISKSAEKLVLNFGKGALEFENAGDELLVFLGGEPYSPFDSDWEHTKPSLKLIRKKSAQNTK